VPSAFYYGILHDNEVTHLYFRHDVSAGFFPYRLCYIYCRAILGFDISFTTALPSHAPTVPATRPSLRLSDRSLGCTVFLRFLPPLWSLPISGEFTGSDASESFHDLGFRMITRFGARFPLPCLYRSDAGVPVALPVVASPCFSLHQVSGY
jgi:hypothetical protein